MYGHKPFLVIADYLTRNGFAVLRYDDRGTASSTGIHDTCSSYDFSTDAEAAFQYLQGRKKRFFLNKIGMKVRFSKAKSLKIHFREMSIFMFLFARFDSRNAQIFPILDYTLLCFHYSFYCFFSCKAIKILLFSENSFIFAVEIMGYDQQNKNLFRYICFWRLL